MKGRRRARSAALQALYELDQSDHPLDRVVMARILGMLRSALAPMVPTEQMRDVLAMAAPPWDRTVMSFTSERLESAGLPPDVSRLASSAAAELESQVDYFLKIVDGVTSNLRVLDDAIARIAPEWPVAQMAPVDRNVLRIALWEIGAGASPVKVAINEAVELARGFSGESARRLVNGALGTFISERHTVQLEDSEDAWSP